MIDLLVMLPCLAQRRSGIAITLLRGGATNEERKGKRNRHHASHSAGTRWAHPDSGGIAWIWPGPRVSSFRRPLRAGQVDSAGDGRPNRADLRARSRSPWPRTPRASGLGNVVLFVHGAGTPAEVSFDVPYKDYSWMAYLANAGFDVFSMDMTGYGRSTRPPAMNDPCNLSKEQQARFVPS